MRRYVWLLVMWTAVSVLFAQRTEVLLEKDWKFTEGDDSLAMKVDYDDSQWQTVTVPHDWAIYGPFDRQNDLQNVAVTQNFETQASQKTGRTGGLPYVGVGWYRTRFDVSRAAHYSLLFDGAMSEARVYVNGKEVCFWPYGYSAFHCDITPYLNKEGKNNVLAVRLENRTQSSRWYPGGGLYRNVHLIATHQTHVPVWGTQITTPHVENEFASVQLRTTLHGVGKESIRLLTQIKDMQGALVASNEYEGLFQNSTFIEQNFLVNNPMLWSPETPHLYYAESKVYVKGELVDSYTTRFGIRQVEVIPEKGFFLNGTPRKFQGVCNHHDLGPLGAAVNVAALRRQLTLLKEMGCDAIRTSHNTPAPELVQLCDEMGFMVMVEPFDEWDIAKCANGYHRFFKEWAFRDMKHMIHEFRNNPSVVMWSIGNEVPTQCSASGVQVASFLQDICHREDPTRPVTCGMDQVSCVLSNGFASVLDVPGLNYRTHRYVEVYEKLPKKIVLGSETASTVSSRGVYKFPVELKKHALYDDNQSSSYDTEACSWSNVPDEDFALAEDYPWTMGQFAWTGFDYLGEPSPYDTDAWPSHSSLFGIFDLASLPKDRYYLYRSIWNKNENTLHVLPHWNWQGREGENTPVFVYTNHPQAELFLNGRSLGVQRKLSASEALQLKDKDPFWLQRRFRLMWMNVPYEPGELRVVAYDQQGNKVEQKIIRTAGKPYRLRVEADRTQLDASGKDLAYLTVTVEDKEGNPCPTDNRMIRFAVKGVGKFRAAANGDATDLHLFHEPQMPLFNGKLTAIVQSGEEVGEIVFEAKAVGVKSAKVVLSVK